MSDKGEDNNKLIVLCVYCLQISTFAVGGTALLGLLLNLVTRNRAKDTWLASHHRWQLRTGLFSLLWIILGFVCMLPYLIAWQGDMWIIPLGLGMLAIISTAVWFVYRVIRGFYRLHKALPMYI